MKKLLLLLALLPVGLRAEVVKKGDTNRLQYELTLPAPPEQVWNDFTGDLLPWWDHTFSPSPKELVLEPRLGGTFHELFDDAGNGAIHARVITVDKNKLLRFQGALGLAGEPVEFVHTFTFAPAPGGKTTLKATITAIGSFDAQLAGLVDGVWKHFLVERFAQYVEKGGRAKNVRLPKPGAPEKSSVPQPTAPKPPEPPKAP